MRDDGKVIDPNVMDIIKSRNATRLSFLLDNRARMKFRRCRNAVTGCEHGDTCLFTHHLTEMHLFVDAALVKVCDAGATCSVLECDLWHPSPVSASDAVPNLRSVSYCKFVSKCTNKSCVFKHRSRKFCAGDASAYIEANATLDTHPPQDPKTDDVDKHGTTFCVDYNWCVKQECPYWHPSRSALCNTDIDTKSELCHLGARCLKGDSCTHRHLSLPHLIWQLKSHVSPRAAPTARPRAAPAAARVASRVAAPAAARVASHVAPPTVF
jgi:hypothetical protein